jgi:competence protein ComEC
MREWLEHNKKTLAFQTILVSNILVWGFFFSLPDSKPHLKVYDVGQGDSIFIETAGGFKILIDGGPDRKVAEYLGKDLPFYSKKIDLLVVTHPQSDHLTGILDVVKNYQIKTLWVNAAKDKTRLFKEWEALLRARKIAATTVYQGDKMIFPDKTTVSVLWPKEEASNTNLNTTSIVVQISFGSFDAIFTGDADKSAQPFTTDNRSIEVFKVPHHGSKTSINEDFVSTLSPAASVISVGAKNHYGHPSLEVVNFLTKIGSKVYRTDTNGTVEIVSDGKNWYTKVQR